jgi:hypothetical protein
MLRRFGVFVVVVLLLLTTLGGNLVVAGHQTVLDPAFVNDGFEEQDAYDRLHESVLEEGGIPFAEDVDSLPPFATDIAERLVTPAYLQDQVERNVRRTYGYLHGDRDEFVVAVNLTPVKDRVDVAVAATVRNTSVREIVEEVGVGEGLVPEAVPANRSLLLSLTDDEQSYEEARETFREAARDAALQRVVDQTYSQYSNDQRLALVIDNYNPDDYSAAEKRRMVAEREGEIKATLRANIEAERGEQIDDQLNESLAGFRDSLTESLGNPSTGLSEGIDREAGDLLTVFVDGLLAEDYRYAEFRSALDTQKAALGTEIGDYAAAEVDASVGDRRVLSENLDANTRQTVSTAQTAVGILDILGIAVPIAAVALVALLWLLSSLGTTALWTGFAALVSGAVGFLGAMLGGDQLTRIVEDVAPEGGPGEVLADVGLGLVDRVLGTLSAQSLALLVGGLLVGSLGAALRLGLLDPGSVFGDDAAATGAGTASDATEAADASESAVVAGSGSDDASGAADDAAGSNAGTSGSEGADGSVAGDSADDSQK